MRNPRVGSEFDVENGGHGVGRHRENATEDAEKPGRGRGDPCADRAERETGADELSGEGSMCSFHHDRSGLDDLLSS